MTRSYKLQTFAAHIRKIKTLGVSRMGKCLPLITPFTPLIRRWGCYTVGRIQELATWVT
mgnify:CR=1 FL=1